MKKNSILFLLCFTILIPIVMPSNMRLVKAEETTSENAYAIEIMAEIMETNRILHRCGLTLADLQRIPIKSPEFYEGLKEVLQEESHNQSAQCNAFRTFSSNGSSPDNTSIDWEQVFNPTGNPAISNESRTSAEMWGYAYEMATLNLTRDPKARDLYQESKDMYMSHYVDIKSGPEYHVNKARSNDGYFSAWITDLDREQYDSYLASTKRTAFMLEITKAVVNTCSIVDTLKKGDELVKLNHKRIILKNIEALITGDKFPAPPDASYISNPVLDLKANFDTCCQLLNETDNPRIFVQNLNNTLALEDYDALYLEAVRDTLIVGTVAAFSGGMLGMLKATDFSALLLVSYEFKDFYDKARWTALIYSNGIRVAERAKRYYKHEYGIGLGLNPEITPQ